jgi:hypothetical protein
MNIKITVYNDEFHTVPVSEVTGFTSAEDAAWYRDHDPILCNLPTKLEPDDPMYDRENIPSEVYNDDTPADVDYSHAEDNGWVMTDEGWLHT